MDDSQGPARTTLIIHIGASKSGSSAIQAFLASNQAMLRSRGVLVPSRHLSVDPGAVTGGQVFFFEQLVKEDPVASRQAINWKMAGIRASVPREQRRYVVISAENLSPHAHFAGLFGEQRRWSQVRIVFYIRRQDDFLLSAWQQWHLKHRGNLGEWLSGVKGHMGHWRAQLAPWEAVYGSENIVVRRFSRDRLVQGDVVRDFLACTGLPEAAYSFPDREINRSYDETIGYLANSARDLFRNVHDDRLYQMFEKLVGEKAFRRRRGGGSSLLSLEDRLRLLEAYEEGNEQLRKTYFPDEPGPLFPAPTRKDVLAKSREEILQDQIAMLVRALFGMQQEIDELRQRLHGG